MKHIKFFTWLIVLNLILAQTYVKIEPNSNVPYLTCSESYLGYVEFSEVTFKKNVIIYDINKNKEIFRDEGRDFVYVLIAEKMNVFILVTGSIFDVPGKEDEQPGLEAYNISTGRLLWRINSPGSLFELSPDDNYLLTNSGGEIGQGNKFEIINVENGEKIKMPINLQSYYATWLNNEEVLIAHNLFEETRTNILKENYDNDKQSEINYLNHKIIDLKDSLDNSLISTDYFEHETIKLKKEINEIFGIINTEKLKRKRTKSAKHLKVDEGIITTELMIFSLKTHAIINRNPIYTENKGKIYMRYGGSTKKILFDENNNILLLGDTNLNNYAYLLNRNLYYLNKIDLKNKSGLKNIKVNNETRITYIEISTNSVKYLNTKSSINMENGIIDAETNHNYPVLTSRKEKKYYYESVKIYFDDNKKEIVIGNDVVAK